MPRTTHEYPFESHVLAGLGERLRPFLELAGPAASYVLVLHPDGSSQINVFRTDTDRDRARRDGVEGQSYLFFDPVDDGMEYRWLTWKDIDRTTMERLIGRTFAPEDFVSMRSRKERDYPQSWGVMF